MLDCGPATIGCALWWSVVHYYCYYYCYYKLTGNAVFFDFCCSWWFCWYFCHWVCLLWTIGSSVVGIHDNNRKDCVLASCISLKLVYTASYWCTFYYYSQIWRLFLGVATCRLVTSWTCSFLGSRETESAKLPRRLENNEKIRRVHFTKARTVHRRRAARGGRMLLVDEDWQNVLCLFSIVPFVLVYWS